MNGKPEGGRPDDPWAGLFECGDGRWVRLSLATFRFLQRFVAEAATRIGLVPIGYADGFRRGLTGTEVVVAGMRRRVLGTVSMDSLAVELGDEQPGATVTLIGDGVLAEEHARVLGTINYEITAGINRDPLRAERRVLDG